MNSDPSFPEGLDIALKSVAVIERDHFTGHATLQGHLYIPLSVIIVIPRITVNLLRNKIVDDGDDQTDLLSSHLSTLYPLVWLLSLCSAVCHALTSILHFA